MMDIDSKTARSVERRIAHHMETSHLAYWHNVVRLEVMCDMAAYRAMQPAATAAAPVIEGDFTESEYRVEKPKLADVGHLFGYFPKRITRVVGSRIDHLTGNKIETKAELRLCKYHVVSREDFLETGQHDRGVPRINLPPVLFMENEDTATARDDDFDMGLRHGIDWYREHSEAALPDYTSPSDPYSVITLIEKRTWSLLKERGMVEFSAIAGEVMQRCGLGKGTVDERTRVNDALRDLALFGLCGHYYRGNSEYFVVMTDEEMNR